MTSEEIATAAEKRLAEIEAEAVSLRAVIAAARGVAPAPIVPIRHGAVITMTGEAYVPTAPNDFPWQPVFTRDDSAGHAPWPIPHGTTVSGGVVTLTGEARHYPQVYRS